MQFEGDYFVLLEHESAAPDFKSYDVSGFRQFCQYLAKNGKKTPKAESVMTPEILQKYAKQIKQAKLEEFRSFLGFTAMKFRDRRKHQIENFVTGRWARMASLRSLRLDGYAEVFRMRRNGIFKRTLPQLCIGIFCI